MAAVGMKSGSRRQAECRPWVQKGDDRRNAPQRARCAVSGHCRCVAPAPMFDPYASFLATSASRRVGQKAAVHAKLLVMLTTGSRQLIEQRLRFLEIGC